jgi:hypothetical protein
VYLRIVVSVPERAIGDRQTLWITEQSVDSQREHNEVARSTLLLGWNCPQPIDYGLCITETLAETYPLPDLNSALEKVE